MREPGWPEPSSSQGSSFGEKADVSEEQDRSDVHLVNS